ncbi:sugar ABC transporter ATP-binding protein [Bradyrhizobium sp. BR13661]|jgi:ribose transport system ATP-binding protein|uniref:sugar ABC transporter ATP-binding protein n=1 Tax=Bradyrhizobium sp. BR13661 TaxID=2940622 RepID=UPI002475BC6A|nr:sugar ABC transporter ATP-binding protein [Bradyrhizobium sp. BR13661]MDH6260521.1 ribose transport system ATP-binding protein [Bradyrhizobium sp. BR13661]
MLTLKGISKSFPGVRALSGVNLDVKPGEIHGLLGENGAGKSTLIKIIAGALAPDEGEIIFAAEPVNWSSPREAKLAGVHVVYQEFALFPQLSIAENIFLGNERRNALGLVDHRRTRTEAVELMGKLGVSLDPRATVASLSVADQQMVEIARAMTHNVRLLILDEPTAVIAGREVALLFDLLRRLRETGVSVLFISHRLDEVFALCDRATILKDGRLVGTQDTAEVTRERLISMMVGRDLGDLFPPRASTTRADQPVLRTDTISVGERVRDVSIALHAGEIVALAGMVGAGRTDLALALFGAIPITNGALHISGERFTAMSPAKAIGLGMGLVTEDRKSQGLAMLLDIAANISGPALSEVTQRGLIDREREMAIAAREIERYRIACRGPATPVATMSGGNQQKVIIARWARLCRSVLILDEPTRGVDVGAKADIYRIMRELADSGLAILMISSELTEVIGMADRVIVMREGWITGELPGCDATEESIMHLATSERAA